jgi:hypothetical protein
MNMNIKNLWNRGTARVKESAHLTDQVGVLALAGAAASQKSRLLIGGGIVCGVVSLVASSPVVAKIALVASGSMFMVGLVEGFKKAINEE